MDQHCVRFAENPSVRQNQYRHPAVGVQRQEPFGPGLTRNDIGFDPFEWPAGEVQDLGRLVAIARPGIAVKPVEARVIAHEHLLAVLAIP